MQTDNDFEVIMVPWEAGKSEYTETEAASILGMSVDQLRALVRQHVVTEDENEGIVTSYRQTDLLMLKMLAQRVPSVA
jgi:hypothetical protein